MKQKTNKQKTVPSHLVWSPAATALGLLGPFCVIKANLKSNHCTFGLSLVLVISYLVKSGSPNLATRNLKFSFRLMRELRALGSISYSAILHDSLVLSGRS
jgi:hypothetical protein